MHVFYILHKSFKELWHNPVRGTSNIWQPIPRTIRPTKYVISTVSFKCMHLSSIICKIIWSFFCVLPWNYARSWRRIGHKIHIDVLIYLQMFKYVKNCHNNPPIKTDNLSLFFASEYGKNWTIFACQIGVLF
jgi:hypothetical protein